MPNHVHLVFHLLDGTHTLQSGLSRKAKFTDLQTSINDSQSGLTALQKTNVIQTILSERVSKIMKSIKGISAREANKILKRKGSFWQSESYDHIVRDEDELA
jgi:REP element-mobilizing transposase RayT